MLELYASPRFAKGSEWVYVAITRSIPIAKLDPQLECCPGRAHELRLIDPEQVVEHFDVRQRRLADPDSPDLVRLNQRDSVVRSRKLPPDSSRTHPSSRAAANNDDAQRLRWMLTHQLELGADTELVAPLDPRPARILVDGRRPGCRGRITKDLLLIHGTSIQQVGDIQGQLDVGAD